MSNTKQKAEELVDKYDELLTYLESKNKAKQCALITVSEIQQHCYEVMKPFWEEVKQEISNM